MGQGDETLLTRPVRLAGKVPIRRPLRDALTQRAFETWIHRDDIRVAVALPPIPPASGHLARILAFGLALLPGAIEAAGRARPGSVLVALTGPGGGDHLVRMGTPASPARPADARPEAAARREGQPPDEARTGEARAAGTQAAPPGEARSRGERAAEASAGEAWAGGARAEAAGADEVRAADGGWIAEVRMPADRFGRVMAGRVPVTPAVAVVHGDRSAAFDLLAVAATLGCE